MAVVDSIFVMLCSLFTVAVVDSIYVTLCCIYIDSSGLYMYVSCCVVFIMAVVDYTCMFHACVLYFQ